MTFYNGSTTTSYPITTTPITTTVDQGVVDVDPGAWGVAIALTVLVIMTLCLVVLYTKARRRRAAERGRHQNIRALSGGVPMGVHAYQNYGPRLEEYITQSRHMSSQASMPPAFIENPPSYEDAMRQANTNYSTGIVNVSFSGSSMNLVHNESNQSVPPPYSPSIESSQDQQHQSSTSTFPQQTYEPASTSSDQTDSSLNKREDDKDKKTVEVDNGVAPNIDKESECSSSDLQTSFPQQQHQPSQGDLSQGATQPSGATFVNNSSISSDIPSSGQSVDSSKTTSTGDGCAVDTD